MSPTFHRPAVLGAGPVGRAVADALVAAGHSPIVVTRSGQEVPGASARAADVTDVEASATTLADVDVLFHCAQPAYHRWTEDFPAMQTGILDIAERIGAAVIAVDNTYAFGRLTQPATETTPFAPVSRKGEVRAALAQELVDAHESGRVKTASVRASDFFGPNVRGSVFGERFFEPLIGGKKVEMYGDLDALHSFAYVPDIATCMVHVADNRTMWGAAWHAPTNPAIAQREFLALAAAAAATQPRFRLMQPWQLRIASVFIKEAKEQIEMLYEFESDYVIDSTATMSATGLEPTPLPAALDATIAWYRSQV